jgi:2Fe-2S ferredoxin
MELVRDAGFTDLLALCGGCRSCGTCHVYIYGALWDKLPPMSSEEDAMLSASGHRSAESRLACQIPFDASLDGLKVTIAPAD